MSHGRKDSLRDKVRRKNWIHLESNTPQIEHGPFQKERLALKYGVVSFLISGRVIATIPGKDWRIPGIGPLTTVYLAFED